jgi:cell division protein FtsL
MKHAAFATLHGITFQKIEAFRIIIIIIIIIQFFIIYVPSQQLQGQLQTQHSVDTGNYIIDDNNNNNNKNNKNVLLVIIQVLTVFGYQFRDSH